MPSDNLPPETHRVRVKLADGSRIYYFSLRGWKGTGFYKSKDRLPHEAGFFTAYAAAMEAAKPKALGYLIYNLVDDYISSPRFQKLGQRTKGDYRKWLDRFSDEFGVDPVAMFCEWESLGQVNEWRDQWGHSPRQYDYAGTVVTILLNWAKKYGKLREHHCSFDKICSWV